MEREKAQNLVQIGTGLIVIGILVYAIRYAAQLIMPLAGLAILAGFVVLVVGLVTPNRNRY